MDMKLLQRKLGLEDGPKIFRKAEELVRLCNVRFNATAFGIGELPKTVLCFELACSVLQVQLDRQKAIRVSAMSEKAYTRSFTAIQNALGVRPRVDMRELAIQFGCVRLVESAYRNLSLYRKRFTEALPEARRAGADFSRPVFTAVAFYLTAKKSKLKVDQFKLLEIAGTSEEEFNGVKTSMQSLCYDTVGVEKRKRDADEVKGNRKLLDAAPGKARDEDCGSDEQSSEEDELDDEPDLVVPGVKRSRRAEQSAKYKDWKSSVLEAKAAVQLAAGLTKKPLKQRTLSFGTAA